MSNSFYCKGKLKCALRRNNVTLNNPLNHPVFVLHFPQFIKIHHPVRGK